MHNVTKKAYNTNKVIKLYTTLFNQNREYDKRKRRNLELKKSNLNKRHYLNSVSGNNTCAYRIK